MPDRLVMPAPVRVLDLPHEPTKVTADEARYVFARDGGCVLAKLVPGHVCSGRLTLEHVKDGLRMGKRAPSDRRHMVVVCLSGNALTVETSKYRPLIRDYLQQVEPRT